VRSDMPLSNILLACRESKEKTFGQQALGSCISYSSSLLAVDRIALLIVEGGGMITAKLFSKKAKVVDGTSGLLCLLYRRPLISWVS
jgi:hypothetical protein